MIHKIAIIGPEASGKTTLARQLVAHFKEPWVPEFARTYLESKNGIYTKVDLDFITKEQIKQEQEALKFAKRLLFCDTSPLVIKVWSNYKYGHCSETILKYIDLPTYSIHLLMKPDLVYEEDPLRENPNIEDRNTLFEIYEQELKEGNSKYAIIKGSKKARFKMAINILQEEFYI